MPALVELLGEAGAVLILLGSLLGWAFASGAFKVWGATFGKMLMWMADHMNFRASVLGYHVGHDFGGIFRDANQAVVAWLQDVKAGSEIEMAWSIRTIHLIWQAQAEAVDWLARETAETFDKLIHRYIPKAAAAAVAVALPYTLIKRWIEAEIAKVVPHITKVIRVVEHDVQTKTITVVKHAAADVLPFPVALPKIERELHGIDELAQRLNKRLHRVEGFVGATVFAAALANVWGIPIRCAKSGGPMGRLARTLCRMPSNVLNDLLGLLADVLVFENVCTLLPLLETAASDIGTPLVAALTEVGAGLCSGAAPAGAMRGPAPTIPPVLFGTVALGV